MMRHCNSLAHNTPCTQAWSTLINMTIFACKTRCTFTIQLPILPLLLCIWLSISSAPAWAQEAANPKTEPATTTEKEQTEEPVIIDDQAPPPPKRLHGSVPRAMAPANAIDLLASKFSSKSGQWIEGNPPFFAIWQSDRSGDAKGALLILHAEGEHPSWPQTTGPLHNSLPDYGWATLAVSLPNPPKKKIPERTLPVKVHPSTITTEEPSDQEENSETAEKTAKAEEPTPPVAEPKTEPKPEPQKKPKTKEDESQKFANYDKAMEERLTAALQFLHDKGQFNIAILGSGDNAIYAERFMQSIIPEITDKKLKDRFEKPVRALLIYNGSEKLSHEKEAYTEWFKDPEIPVFDIFSAHREQYVKAARQRQILAKRKKVETYSTLRIAEISYETSWRENRLSRRIRSFLDAKVKGIEIDNATLKKNKN
jgi:hypothetical protein